MNPFDTNASGWMASPKKSPTATPRPMPQRMRKKTRLSV